MTERDTPQEQPTQGNNVIPQPLLPGQRHATSQSMKDEAPCYGVRQSYLQVHRKAAFKQSNINHNQFHKTPQIHISWPRLATPKPHFMAEVHCNPKKRSRYADVLKINVDQLSIRCANMGSVSSARCLTQVNET